jgi:hypothetical protein
MRAGRRLGRFGRLGRHLSSAVATAAIVAGCGGGHATPAAATGIPAADPAAQGATRTYLAGTGRPLVVLDGRAVTLSSKPSQAACRAATGVTGTPAVAASDVPDTQLGELYADESSALSALSAACAKGPAPSAAVTAVRRDHATISQRLHADGVTP